MCDSLPEGKSTLSRYPLKEAEPVSDSHDLESTEGTSSDISGKLSPEQIHESLSTFNHNPEGRLVYTKISLVSLALRDIQLLETYVFLQHITLDNNSLTTLQSLRALKNLVYVSAKNNQLSESIFNDLEGSARTLETLCLEGNALESLEGLQNLKYLTNLCVSHNHISSLRYVNFATLSSLLRLDASWNEISIVEVKVFAISRLLRHIDLSHNSIRHLHFMAYVTTNLETLIFSNNELPYLPLTLVQCHAMVTLDLSHNHLENVEDFIGLSSQKLLRHLSIEGNPFLHSSRPFGGKKSNTFFNTGDSTDFSTTGGDTKNRMDDAKTLRQFLSHSEITYEDGDGPINDNHQELPNPFAGDSLTVRRSACGPSRKATPAHNFADLTASYAYGLVRHALVSCRVTPTLYEIDPTSELFTFPYDRQVSLYLISILPQLATLDRNIITDDDVSRAMIYFRPATYVHPCEEDLDDRNNPKEVGC
ncbi:unnamed protein product [Phytomonas sp. EM1]|nr:unnamed protein product [Phytomonas sp. EM1]|eukprot:CCW60024.1 unnamed protein product [Phytomonas sp. isolate EM1]